MKNFLRQKNKSSTQTKAGFTLIELMVATTIFMIIMLMGMGALLVASNSAKKSKALHSSMDNLNFAMESMTRTLRMSNHFYCVTGGITLPVANQNTSDCISGGTALAFTPPNQTTSNTAYLWHDNGNLTHSLQRYVSSSGYVNMTSPDIDIQGLEFIVRGSDPLDLIQPSVRIIMKGVITINGDVTSFAIQTLASQRSFE